MNYLVAGLALLQLSAEAGVKPADQQVMLLNVPLFHITGSVPVLLVSIAIGRKMIIMHKWDAGEALRLIEKERCTYFVGVPTMSLEMMQHPDRDKYDLSSLVDIASGGAPRPPEHVDRLGKALPGKQPGAGLWPDRNQWRRRRQFPRQLSRQAGQHRPRLAAAGGIAHRQW